MELCPRSGLAPAHGEQRGSLPAAWALLAPWVCPPCLVGSTPTLTAGDDGSDAGGQGLILCWLEEQSEKHQSGWGRDSVETNTEHLAVLWNCSPCSFWESAGSKERGQTVTHEYHLIPSLPKAQICIPAKKKSNLPIRSHQWQVKLAEGAVSLCSEFCS